MTVKYLHIRYGTLDPLGSGVEVDNKGGATIAYTELDGFICLAPAWCSIEDNFSREVGRTIAADRLRKDGPWEILEGVPPTDRIIDWCCDNLFSKPVYIHRCGHRWMITEVE